MGVKYLLTGFINQDALENFFSVVRNRGGYNPTPTVRQFRIAMQQNMNIRLQVNVETANCEFQDIEYLDMENIEVDDKENIQENTFAVVEATSASIKPTEEECPIARTREVTDETKHEEIVTLETCSGVYVAGYLAYKVIKQYNCEKCISNLVKDRDELLNHQEIFISLKDYCREVEKIKNLQRPTDEFSNIIFNLLEAFNHAYNDYKYGENVSKNIYGCLTTFLSQNHPLWYNNVQVQCGEHIRFLLNLFIKMKLFRTTKWETENYNRKKELRRKDNKDFLKPHRKIRILQS